jgi:hypothetical protein
MRFEVLMTMAMNIIWHHVNLWNSDQLFQRKPAPDPSAQSISLLLTKTKFRAAECGLCRLSDSRKPNTFPGLTLGVRQA